VLSQAITVNIGKLIGRPIVLSQRIEQKKCQRMSDRFAAYPRQL
jgi:hypothetical protein